MDYSYSPVTFKRWADKRRSDPLLIEDAEKAVRWRPTKPAHTIERPDPESKEPASSRRGRPELKTPNPVASYMSLLCHQRPHWVDAIVYGSTATGAGSSSGKLNVQPRAVLAALYLKTISANAVKTADITLRTAQTVAKAARHAAHGIGCYLDRHPMTKARMDLELSYELAAD